jgi:hypothetical protein
MTDDTLQHWATLPPDKLGPKVQEKFDEFEMALLNRDLPRMQAATYAYYGQDEQGYDTATVGRTGKQGQIRILKDNEFRTVLRNKLTIATSEPSAFVPVPSNSDSDSQASTVLARAVLDYYFDELGAEKQCVGAAESSEALSWSWVDVAWEDEAGPLGQARPGIIPAPQDGTPPPAPGGTDATPPPAGGEPSGTPPPNLRLTQRRVGDAAIRHLLPTDVGFEYDARGDVQWLILRRWINKFDLAAREEARAQEALALGDAERARAFAENASRLRAMSGDTREDRVSRFIRGWSMGALGATDAPRVPSDEVAVLELRHRKTPGCPEGRWCRVVAGNLVLDCGPARYVDETGEDDLACYRMAAGERFGTPRAYTSAHDALGLQKAVDTLTSIPYSNQAAQGLNVIVSAEGSDLRPEDLREGLLALYAKGDPAGWPRTLDLAHTDPQIFEFRDTLKGDLGSKLGMDDQAMGRGPLPSSGSLAVLLDDKTQRSVSGLAKAYNELRRQVATGILKRFKQFGHESRTLPLMLGKSKRAVMGSFAGSDLGGIDRVKVETTASIMRSVSGRQVVAESIINAKAAGMPIEALITFWETGKWEPLVEDEHAEMLTIREENERLLSGEALEPVGMNGAPLPPGPDGQPPTSTALFTDNPIKHLLGHRPVLASPAARKNPGVVANAGAHMMAHVRIAMQWMAGDPLLLLLHGPPPQMPMAGMLPPGTQTPGGAPAESGGGEQPQKPPSEPRAPSPPKNPSNGQSWNPTGEVTPNA